MRTFLIKRTSILGAVCAMGLSASAMASQSDTLNVYMINGETIEHFDGRQLVGQTVSDYKTMISQSNNNGVVTVTKTHVIRTDGKQAHAVSSYTASFTKSGEDKSQITIVGSDVDSVSCVHVIPGTAGNEMEVFIDGKKSSKEEMAKIKPEKIASMTAFNAGSKEAVKLTGKKNVNVIKIELKK